MTTQPLQFKHLTTPHETELEALREQLRTLKAELAIADGFRQAYPGKEQKIRELYGKTNELRKQLYIDRQLVDEFATLAGLAKFENEDLRRQLSEAQGIINTYSVELGKLNQEHAAMRQHCETINEQLKAALAENERLRKMGRDTAV